MSPEFSAVITCYFEEKSVREFARRLSDTLRATGREYEMIFVNDGSTDGTLKALRELQSSDPRVTAVVDLSRNFGQTAAITAGIEVARGRHFIFMDSDLQLDPEELPRLLAAFDSGHDLVNGRRQTRRDPWSRRLASFASRLVLNGLFRANLQDLGCTFRIVGGHLVRSLRPGPSNTILFSEMAANTNRIAEVVVTHRSRQYGRSGWTFGKLLDFFTENLVGICHRPFQIAGVICAAFFILIALRLALFLFFDFSILPEVTNGLILNVLVLNGAILVLAGEFSLRGFRKLDGKPKYVIRRLYSRRPTPAFAETSEPRSLHV